MTEIQKIKKYSTLISYLSLLSYGLTITVVGPALHSIQKDYMISFGEIGLLFTLQSAGFIIAVLPGGFFIDRFSLKSMAIFGQAILSAGLIAFTFSNTLVMGLVAYFLIGIGGGSIQISTNTIISSTNSNKRTSSLNILHLFFGIGCLTGPLLSALFLEDGYGWRNVYLVLFIYSFLLTGLFSLSKFPKNTDEKNLSRHELSGILHQGYTFLLALAVLLYIGVEMGLNSWAVIYMENNIGAGTLEASALLSYFWMAVTFGRFICIYLSKKMRPQVLLLLLASVAVIAYGIFVNAHEIRMAALALVFT